jgi:hypothetical protein
VLRARFATSSRDAAVTVNQLSVLSAEIRLTENAIGRWARSLNASGQPRTAVSRQHRQAALTRWHGANA